MVPYGIPTNSGTDMPVLFVCGQNYWTETYAKSTCLRIARCTYGLQPLSNPFQRLDVLPYLPSNVVQRIQFHLPAGRLLRQRGCSTVDYDGLLLLHLKIYRFSRYHIFHHAQKE